MGPFAPTLLRFLPFLIILVAVTSFVPSARADSVQFSFKIDPVACKDFPAGTCSDPTAGSGIFEVTPYVPPPSFPTVVPCTENAPAGSFYQITSVVGEVNGHAMTFLPNLGNQCDNNLSLGGFPISFGFGTFIYFAANNQQWGIEKNDITAPSLYQLENFNTGENIPITWSAQVFVPEPSTLILLAIGLLGMLLVLKRKIGRSRPEPSSAGGC